MKNRIFVPVLILGVVLSGGIFARAMAQSDLPQIVSTSPVIAAGHFGGPGVGHEDRMAQKLEMMTTFLELSDEQKQTIRGIMDAEFAKNRPLREQLHEGRKQLWEMLNAPDFNESAVRTLAAQQAEKRIDLMIAHAKAKNKVFAELNEEQQEKARAMMDLMGVRRHMKGMMH